jgi:hypothetical protein
MMILKFLRLPAVALPLLVFAGCATLFASKRKTVAFRTEPVGAQVLINGNPVGTTPYQMELQKKKEYIVTFRLEGYREVTCEIGKKVGAGWVVLDVLGGLVPIVIDAITGDWHNLDKDSCDVTLTPGTGR